MKVQCEEKVHKRGLGRLCAICYQRITSKDVDIGDFDINKTCNGNDIVTHKHCKYF